MKRFHIALSTTQITATIADYSKRLGEPPCVVVEGEYALWRTSTLNVSIRQDASCPAGTMRHLGWEDSEAEAFGEEADVNGITWERFSAEAQAEEIRALWPTATFAPL